VVARNSLEKMQKKLKIVKNGLKGWGVNLRGKYIKRKKDITAELNDLELMEESGKLSADQIKRKVQIQQELLKILENEENVWLYKGEE
jgi:hypothetical protein